MSNRKKNQDKKQEQPQIHIPLYNDLAIKELNHRDMNAHAGLWYEKFCNRWGQKDNKWTLEKVKMDWIETITCQHGGMTGDETRIEEAITRFTELVDKLNGDLLYMKTASRFVTGLGNSNPVENGFTWHPILGTAYIPGTSIKGLVRSWVREFEKLSREELYRIFGPEESSPKHNVGSVIFFDALPMSSIKCEADILTPHYGKYYENPTSHPPRDWESPIPIPYLVVAQDQLFIFGIAPRCKGQNPTDAEKAIYWLQQALIWFGAGAKTAVGYGRFSLDEKKQKKWERQKQAKKEQEEHKRKEEEEKQKLALMTPIEREMYVDGYCENQEQFNKAMSKWIDRLEGKIDGYLDDRSEIATRLYQWYQKNKSEQWEKPNKKNKEKIPIIKKYLPSE